MSGMRGLVLLFRLQSQRWWNQLQDLGWRPGWPLFIGACLLLLSLVGTHLVLWIFIQRLLDADAMRQLLPLRFTRYEDVSDQGARLMIVFLSSTLLSALCLRWGQWQSSSRDSEEEWFAAQPLSPLMLFIKRCLVDSLLPQGFALCVLPFFVLLAYGRGWTLWAAVLMAAALLVIFQALLAAPRLFVDLWLRRQAPQRTRSIRAILGFSGVGFILLALQCLSGEPTWAISVVREGAAAWDKTPVAWALAAILLHDQTAILKLVATLMLVHAICYGGAALLLKKPKELRAGWVGSRQLSRQSSGLGRYLWDRLHPLTRRDLRLLGRDQHFLLQILVGPLVFSLLPMGMMQQDWGWRTGPILLSLAFFAGLLLLLGAVLQILPMEGRSIWMLYTWPPTLSQFLRRRLFSLLSLASIYSLIVLGFGLLKLGNLDLEGWRLAYGLWGLLCFAFILASAAVVDYRPEQQHRSPMLVSYGILILGGLYAWFFFEADWRQSLTMMLLLGTMALALWWHMETVLPALLDRHAPRNSTSRVVFAGWLVTLYLLGSSLVWLGFHA